jgi:hypothetical protein
MGLQVFGGELLTCCLTRFLTKRIMESELSSLKDEVRVLRAEVGRLRGMTPLNLPIILY